MSRDVYEGVVAVGDGSKLVPLAGIRVSVRPRGSTTTFVNIYQSATGASQGPTAASGATNGPNPFVTGPSGAIEFWCDAPDEIDVVIEDTQGPPRIVPRTFGWNPLPSGAGTLPGALLEPEAITEDKLAYEAVTPAILSPTMRAQLGVSHGGDNRRGFSLVAAQASTASTSPAADLGGPEVTVNVPVNGLVCVQAQLEARMAAPGADGRIELYEDGEESGWLMYALQGGPVEFDTLQLGLTNEGAHDAGRAVARVFATTPGEHTYALRYGTDDPANAITVRNRKLWVWTMGF